MTVTELRASLQKLEADAFCTAQWLEGNSCFIEAETVEEAQRATTRVQADILRALGTTP